MAIGSLSSRTRLVLGRVAFEESAHFGVLEELV